ncbi:MAG TPA: glucose 1-dehydrogenase [Burkholderiales bacterium]|nr:glucose 1-dehydrogenase [Burkholderiales bacterium]
MRLKNKVALVTGAGSGFGEGIASRFAEEGAKVMVNDIHVTGAERVAAAIRKSGGTAEFVQADVAVAGDWAAMVHAALGAYGRIDVVVNNAGWTHRMKPLLEVTDEEFEKVYAINVRSIYLSAKHVVPVFRKQGGGCFVNIASTAGVRPRPGLTVYNSSKGAVITMSRSLAAELGPDQIRVNVVNPVFSPLTGLSADFAGGKLTPETQAKFVATIPLGRPSTPRDVANAVLYLASDEAEFISGVCLEVDGARCV